jgi:hypothetical protein
MTITIYKDDAANAVFIEDANGVQFINSLQATLVNGFCSIHDLAKDVDIATNVEYTEFVDNNGASYGNTAEEVCNALNSVFSSSGTPTAELPNITSSLAVNLTEGETLNYELTADYGVAYEWDLSNVPGITTVEGSLRKLIGGSSLAAGTYNIPVKAINYNGEDSETIVLTVSTPPFSNTKSVQFNNQDWLGANASLLDADLGRAGNGSGSSDAWTIAFWFKGGTSTNNGQTIFYFGDNDTTNAGHLYIRYQGGNNRLRFRYGSSNNALNFQSADNSIPANTWTHVVITYDGGTTGASSGSINSYYGRFTVYINGVDAISAGAWSHSNYGYTGGIDPDNLRIGRYASGNYMQNSCKVDEFAVWDSDQSANVSAIYNSGTPFDLSTLTTGPRHWWRMGDGDTYSNLQDSGSEGNCVFVMYNMTSADIVSDVP